MNYKLLAMDLDGTLLNSNGVLPVKNITAVRALSQLGIKAVIATGRLEHSMRRFYDELELDTPLITCNGALVRTKEREIIRHTPIALPIAVEIAEFSLKHHLHLNFYHVDELSVFQTSDWGEWSNRQTPEQVMRIRPLDKLLSEPPTKLVIVDDPENIQRLLAEFTERYAGVLYSTISEKPYLEMMSVEANKGNALLCVCDYLGIRPEQAVGVGDSFNDIPLLEAAGLAVAVDNAAPTLKEKAEMVVGSNNSAGISEIIEKIFLASVV